ncbi:MAG: NADH-quinone oxidoreductase subunit NuoE [Ignavibacteriae bacterium]|nr:NADH-quinone oxidoreductase subunit NuoE [Ignavibacteriota bacterium]MCB9205759.1 NADH-quinone oxidoreductase subunit NuoE [Ignavibacteriales bacterium]MCB9209921.1 NADH-quinone oxidoreductase subunit NuoE [Ignavibacteriales bacterium]MCB9219364.1 NADH-quinone oxidoreductase subunit NuoE [Ignavibacteriales bacterium]MCB9260251.1 NADH-quinone oxidoreductase subunit NuoE [Ignavibacteriales bacterium]
MYRKIFENYEKNDRSSLIPLLQDVQSEFGYLPEDVLNEVAEYINISKASVYGVATFYNQFRLTPLGKYVIRVCRGTACHVKNSANILIALETELGIKAGCTSKDKLFTLETVACIGACSIAPVININDEYYGRLTVKEIPKIIKKYKNAAKKEEELKTVSV